MKRGLVLLDPQESPPVELTTRVIELQSSMRRKGVAACLVYGDVAHSGDITYLCNLSIYWNEALLAIPLTGSPALLTKLSSRVHPWMRSISNLTDLRSGPNLADLASAYVIGMPPGIMGLVEMDWWPAQVVNEMREKLPGWGFMDLGPLIQEERRRPSESELLLLREGARISATAVATGMNTALTNKERAGQAELSARMAGVEDVFVFCHPATAEADTVEVLSEYRGYWTVAARVVCTAAPQWMPVLEQAYRDAVLQLRSGVDVLKVREAVKGTIKDGNLKWRADLIHHTDLETGGDFRLPSEETKPFETGSVVALRLAFQFGDGTFGVTADTFQIDDDGVQRLTSAIPNV